MHKAKNICLLSIKKLEIYFCHANTLVLESTIWKYADLQLIRLINIFKKVSVTFPGQIRITIDGLCDVGLIRRKMNF